jgi:hypothetical protein
MLLLFFFLCRALYYCIVPYPTYFMYHYGSKFIASLGLENLSPTSRWFGRCYSPETSATQVTSSLLVYLGR